ncbi:MAG TPA: anhydro-N-acetylmuramic acid kinase [Cyclobacteriaceae bacterium]|nr:anhydro-N-acetylmuramic acid kinase [Cyclobacteriaceae bacterium]
MNKNIRSLHRIASKKSRLIIGLMSGTSLDGLDVALCRISGSGTDTIIKIEAFQTWPYSPRFKNSILRVFAKPLIDFQKLTELNAVIGKTHGQLVLKSLKKWGIRPAQVDCIASHGQTVFHAPKFLYPKATCNSTLQIGDGDHLAVETGVLTISDFRQKHIAAGGEGAPLAVYGDYLLFSEKGKNRLLLNAGGIGNFTYLPASAKANDVFVTDTGPANTLIDQVMRKYLDQPFDRDAKLAKSGACNTALLTALMTHSFFKRKFPKTIGPELFNVEYIVQAQQASGTETISLPDLLATLTTFSAVTMANAITRVIGKKKFELYISGGGAHNPLMMHVLKEQLPNVVFHTMNELGISGDAKEAVLFAVLANEALVGGSINFGNRSRIPSVSMGKISFAK